MTIDTHQRSKSNNYKGVNYLEASQKMMANINGRQRDVVNQTMDANIPEKKRFI